MKNWWITLLSVVLLSCGAEESQTGESNNFYQIVGEAQGTTYAIVYEGNDLDPGVVQHDIDSLLAAYDLENSIYKPGSLIATLNESVDSAFSIENFENKDNFIACLDVAKELFHITEGAFNPAVYPLVNYWGFHKEDFNYEPDSSEIEELIHLIDFSDNQYWMENHTIYRNNPQSKIDFNALAQGHSVDVVGDYLASIGVKNYMVEIGGEITCGGKNPDGKLWTIGIDKPVDDSDPGEHGFQFIAAFSDMSLATSGNYRKFYEIEGQKYSHTIDPITGYPAKHNLLSVTVITPECIYADAYATAFMVLGLEASIAFVQNHPNLGLHVYFVYDVEGQLQTKMTDGFEEFILA